MARRGPRAQVAISVWSSNVTRPNVSHSPDQDKDARNHAVVHVRLRPVRHVRAELSANDAVPRTLVRVDEPFANICRYCLVALLPRLEGAREGRARNPKRVCHHRVINIFRQHRLLRARELHSARVIHAG